MTARYVLRRRGALLVDRFTGLRWSVPRDFPPVFDKNAVEAEKPPEAAVDPLPLLASVQSGSAAIQQSTKRRGRNYW